MATLPATRATHPLRCSIRPTRRHDTRARAIASDAASSARVTSPSIRYVTW